MPQHKTRKSAEAGIGLSRQPLLSACLEINTFWLICQEKPVAQPIIFPFSCGDAPENRIPFQWLFQFWMRRPARRYKKAAAFMRGS